MVVPAGPLWIALNARRGRQVVALLAEPAGRVVTGDGARWTAVAAAAGMGVAVRLRAPERTAPGDASTALIEASVGGVPVPLAAEGDELVADLTAALPAGPFALTIRAGVAGPITVQPLVLRYAPAP